MLFLAILTLLVSCNEAPKAVTDTASKKDIVQEKNKVVTKNNCLPIDTLLKSIGYTYEIQLKFKSLAQRCFSKLYSSDFGKLKSKEFILVENDLNHSSTKFFIKKLVFRSTDVCRKMFEAYSKGYDYDEKCLGMKEPHFLIMDKSTLLIIYVYSEYQRESLRSFQSVILKELKSCKNYEFHLVK